MFKLVNGTNASSVYAGRIPTWKCAKPLTVIFRAGDQTSPVIGVFNAQGSTWSGLGVMVLDHKHVSPKID